MESNIFGQAAEFLREHKTAARAMSIFLCLAIVVTAATVGVLTSTGQALTRQVKVLTCTAAAHEHTEACEDEEGNLICAQADYLVHVHNDDCYDEKGVLVCPLPEIEKHEHTDECYETVETLVCGLEEDAPLICQLPEHEHDESCYIEEKVLTCQIPEGEHVHDDSCYTSEWVLSCGLEEGEEHTHDDSCYTEVRTLSCGLEEGESHTHDESCYTVELTLGCGMEEHTHTAACYDLSAGHHHDESCVEISEELVCGKLELHTHDDSCYELDENGERIGPPICGQIELLEHVHDADCFTIEEVPVDEGGESETENGEDIFFFQMEQEQEEETICGLQEHTHDETCLDENGELICGLEEHVHDESCLTPPPVYYCGLEEHTHDETCLDENGELICGLEEHTHDESCLTPPPVYYCGLEEHTHDESCLDENGEVICGLEEHVHDESCLEEIFSQTAEVEGIRVTAEYTAAANIPEGAVLKVVRILPEGDTAEYYEKRLEEADKIYSEQVAEEENQFFSPLALLNIGFYLADGTEVQPAAPITVTVQFLDETGAVVGDPVTVIHFADTGTEILDGSALDEDQSSVFTTNSFSSLFIGTGGVAEIASTNDSATSDGGGKEFAHSKTIDYLGDGTDNLDTDADNNAQFTDDLYRLYLDMTGESEPLNLVVIIDRSNSMSETMNGKTRWKTIYDILEGNNGLLKEFLDQNKRADGSMKPDSECNYASVVWFAGTHAKFTGDPYGGENAKYFHPNSSSEGGVVFDWTNKYSQTAESSYTISPRNLSSDGDGGVTCTNYVAGLYQAHVRLNNIPSAAKDHRTVVVFMSDGVPVYYYMASDMNWNNPGSMIRYGVGSEAYVFSDHAHSWLNLIRNYVKKTLKITNGYDPSYKVNGSKVGRVTDFYYSPYMNETKKIFNGGDNSFLALHPNITFYTVAIDLNESLYGFSRTKLLSDMASAGGGSMFSATNATGLKQFLQQIMFPAGVTISDDLSAYVDLYKTDPDILVTATKKSDGSKTTIWKGPASGLSVGTGNVVQNGTAYQLNGANVIKNVTYDESTKTIAVHFVDDYCLSKDYTYTFSFNVKLTEQAYNDYAANQDTSDSSYNATGDTGTDYGSNTTSSGQGGFRSNDKATVDYNINGKTDSLEYDHPVVQAWGTKFQIEKQDERGILPGMAFRLEYKGQDGSTKLAPLDGSYAEATDKDGQPLDGYYLTDENGRIAYDVLPSGTYTLKEYGKEGYRGAGQEITVATFKVVGGRICEVLCRNDENASLGVSAVWESDESGHAGDKGTENNKPNTVYGDSSVLTITNTKDKRKLSFLKVDSSGENKLEGAVFELYYAKRDESGSWITEGEAIATLTSNADGQLGPAVSEFPLGDYILREKTAPQNYKKLEKNIVFSVSAEGVNILDDGGGAAKIVGSSEGITDAVSVSIYNNWGTVTMELYKVDATGSEHLGGAKFELYGPYDSGTEDFDGNTDFRIWSGTSVEETGLVQGDTPFPEMQYGKVYFLVETAAPVGYEKVDVPIRIAVDGSGKASAYPVGDTGKDIAEFDEETKTWTVTVHNYNGYELPETGGEAMAVTASGLATLILGLGALLLLKKRQREA